MQSKNYLPLILFGDYREFLYVPIYVFSCLFFGFSFISLLLHAYCKTIFHVYCKVCLQSSVNYSKKAIKNHHGEVPVVVQKKKKKKKKKNIKHLQYKQENKTKQKQKKQQQQQKKLN